MVLCSVSSSCSSRGNQLRNIISHSETVVTVEICFKCQYKTNISEIGYLHITEMCFSNSSSFSFTDKKKSSSSNINQLKIHLHSGLWLQKLTFWSLAVLFFFLRKRKLIPTALLLQEMHSISSFLFWSTSKNVFKQTDGSISESDWAGGWACCDQSRASSVTVQRETLHLMPIRSKNRKQNVFETGCETVQRFRDTDLFICNFSHV